MLSNKYLPSPLGLVFSGLVSLSLKLGSGVWRFMLRGPCSCSLSSGNMSCEFVLEEEDVIEDAVVVWRR